MASTTVLTLLVLLADSGDDFEQLWYHTGGYNDPDGMKTSQSPQDVAKGGNFRSALIDDWKNASFDTITVSAMNLVGDVLWETEFNKSRSSNSIQSWMAKKHIIPTARQNDVIVHNDGNYRFHISPDKTSNTSWLAVSVNSIYHHDVPRIFSARTDTTAFERPYIEDSYLGCWNLSTITCFNSTNNVTHMSPPYCISLCDDQMAAYDVAGILSQSQCCCADVPLTVSSWNLADGCNLSCPGSPADTCGGNDSNVASIYQMEAKSTPGEVDAVRIYEGKVVDAINYTFNLATELQTTDPIYITGFRIQELKSTFNDTTVSLACNLDCSTEYKTIGTNFRMTTGEVYEFSIRKVTCLQLIFTQIVHEFRFQIKGPEVKKPVDHIEVPMLVIRGKRAIQNNTDTNSTATTSSSNATVSSNTSDTLATTSASSTNTSTTSATAISNSGGGGGGGVVGTTNTAGTTNTFGTGPTSGTTNTANTGGTTNTYPTTNTQSTSTTAQSVNSNSNTNTTTAKSILAMTTTDTTPIPTTSTTTPASLGNSGTKATTTSASSGSSNTSNSSSNTSSDSLTNSSTTPSSATAADLPLTSTSKTATATPIDGPNATVLATTKPDGSMIDSGTNNATGTPTTNGGTANSSTNTNTESSTGLLVETTTTGSGTTANSTTQTSSNCVCLCGSHSMPANATKTEVQEKVEEIQKDLAVNTSSLSSTTRRLSSAKDNRPSAQGIGYVGLCIISLMVMALVVIDAPVLVRELRIFAGNLKEILRFVRNR